MAIYASVILAHVFDTALPTPQTSSRFPPRCSCLSLLFSPAVAETTELFLRWTSCASTVSSYAMSSSPFFPYRRGFWLATLTTVNAPLHPETSWKISSISSRDRYAVSGTCSRQFQVRHSSVSNRLTEKVHARKHKGVDYSKNWAFVSACRPRFLPAILTDVGLISNGIECHRSHHHDHKIEDPVRGRRDGVRRSSNVQRRYLCRIEPCHAEPANGEERVEDEQEHGGANSSGLVIWGVHRYRVQPGKDGHRCSLSSSAEQHKVSSAEFLDREDSDPGGDELILSEELY